MKLIPEITCPKCQSVMPIDHLKLLGQHVVNKHDYSISAAISWMDKTLMKMMKSKSTVVIWRKFIDKKQKEGKSGYSCQEGCEHLKDV